MKLSSRKQLLSEADFELKRMQKLAGLLKENTGNQSLLSEGIFDTIKDGFGKFIVGRLPLPSNMLEKGTENAWDENFRIPLEKEIAKKSPETQKEIKKFLDELKVTTMRKIRAGEFNNFNGIVEFIVLQVKEKIDEIRNR